VAVAFTFANMARLKFAGRCETLRYKFGDSE
jgi:hypothetical protein